jgi:hypothetical protein
MFRVLHERWADAFKDLMIVAQPVLGGLLNCAPIVRKTEKGYDSDVLTHGVGLKNKLPGKGEPLS